jgi:hypothetical protein
MWAKKKGERDKEEAERERAEAEFRRETKKEKIDQK